MPCKCNCTKKACLHSLKHYALDVLILIAIICGTGLGVALANKKHPWTKRELIYFKFPGDLFLRMIKMVIIPLVVSGVISGVSSLNVRSPGKVAAKTLLYYFLTAVVSVHIGVFMVLAIRPGVDQKIYNGTTSNKHISGVDSLLDLIRNMFPKNIVTAAFEKTMTTMYVPTSTKPASNTSVTPYSAYSIKMATQKETNVLGLIVFSFALGMAINKLGENGRVVRTFFREVNEGVLSIVDVILWFCPIGILFLIAGKIIGLKDPKITMGQLVAFIGTVASGMAIHMIIILPVVYLIFVRKNPFKYMWGMAEALWTGFSTGSSLVTLPATLHCIEERNKVDRRISRFVVPFGATINIDGTALYEAVAAIFIAQINHIPMTFGKVMLVSLTASLSAIGLSGVPEAGLVTMMLVLEVVGLPTKDVPLVLSVDWFLDRLRTIISVWGDSVGAAIVQKYSEDDLNITKNAHEEDVEFGHENEFSLEDVNHLKRPSRPDIYVHRQDAHTLV